MVEGGGVLGIPYLLCFSRDVCFLLLLLLLLPLLPVFEGTEAAALAHDTALDSHELCLWPLGFLHNRDAL